MPREMSAAEPVASQDADSAGVLFGAATDAGPVRTLNEDSLLTLPASAAFPGHLFAVADGLGGFQAGEVASRIVVEQLTAATRSVSLDRGDRWIRQAMHLANLAIYDHSHSDAGAFGCQSTATVLLVQPDAAVIGHVGDCRVYRVRDGGIEQRTSDHTRVAEMLRLRILTQEQALHHPARNQLTRSLGAEVMVHADISREAIHGGDVFVLCSDGLWNEVTRAEVAETVAQGSPGDAARRLVEIALERQASDNVSVVVVRIEHVNHQSTERARRWLPWR